MLKITEVRIELNIMLIKEDSSIRKFLKLISNTQTTYLMNIQKSPTDVKGETKKLLTTFEKIEHNRYLQQALKFGLNLINVHSVLNIFQTAWMRKYILLNTYLRTKATNKFEFEFKKLMDNSVFDKSMQNEKLTLCSTDIDLFFHKILTDNLYEDIKNDLQE